MFLRQKKIPSPIRGKFDGFSFYKRVIESLFPKLTLYSSYKTKKTSKLREGFKMNEFSCEVLIVYSFN
jgi:hypothetical protein